jgi:hypothetical protein
MSQELMMLKAAMGIPPQNASMGGGAQAPSGVATPSPITDGIMQAQGERTPYMEALAKRSVPTV